MPKLIQKLMQRVILGNPVYCSGSHSKLLALIEGDQIICVNGDKVNFLNDYFITQAILDPKTFYE